MIVKIPIKMVSESNSSQHWAKKSKRHKTQKALVRMFLNSYMDPNWKPPYIIKLTRHAPRAFDSDNLQGAFKWVRDAASEFLLSCNTPGRADNDARIQWHYAYEKTSAKEHYITIEVIPVPHFSAPVF